MFQKIPMDSDLMILDTGILHGMSERQWVRTYFDHVNKYSELDVGALIQKSESLKDVLEFLERDEATTISDVISEFSKVADIFSAKLDYLNRFSNPQRTTRGNKRKGKWLKKKFDDSFDDCYDSDIADEARELLEEIVFRYKKIADRAEKQKQVPENKLAYDGIKNVVDLVAKNTGAMRSYHESKQKIKDHTVDKSLVAMALYQSIFENNSSSIVTIDSDIARLAKSTAKVLVYDDHPYAGLIKDSFENSPVRVIATYDMHTWEKEMSTTDRSKWKDVDYWENPGKLISLSRSVQQMFK